MGSRAVHTDGRQSYRWRDTVLESPQQASGYNYCIFNHIVSAEPQPHGHGGTVKERLLHSCLRQVTQHEVS